MDESMVAMDVVRSATASSLLFHNGQSFEEMQQLLVCVSLELDSTRQAAKAQCQLHEARVRHLEELLKNTRRERDEAREKYAHLKETFLTSSAMNLGPGLTQDAQLRTLAGLQPMESVASMTEPSRATLSEVHRKLQGQQQQQLELQKHLEYVSSMTEPTRDTLTEVHRKMQEHQQMQQQLGLQHQHQHGMDLQHQHNNHSQLDLRSSSAPSHLEFQSHEHQLEELRQHLEIQHKDHMQDQLHMDMVITDRQATDASHSEVVNNGSDAKSTTWTEFPSNVHMDIPDDPCLILESPKRMHIKLTQGLSSPHVDPHSPARLEDLKKQLQQQQQQHQGDSMQLHLHQQHQKDNLQLHLHQQQQKDNMQLHLHQQQESEQLLSHMQQGQAADSRSLHLQDEQPMHHQLTQHQDGVCQSLQGTNDGVMNMSVLQHSPWPVPLMGLSSPLSNACPSGISDQLLQSSCLKGGSVVASILSPLERFADSGSSTMLLPRPVHLPEPPEADPQVMLNSLPEKGKLLQAVMNAGPLLQTLLVAGPLPQWRHPPPALDSEEIPRVSMGIGGVIMPPVEQALGRLNSHGSLVQVMHLCTPAHPNPSQNGFCS